MSAKREQLTTVKKEMGITHNEFYTELANLLDGIPYQQTDDTITFQVNGKKVEITLEVEGFRLLGKSVRLPVTPVTLRFFDFSEDEQDIFLRRFNIKFMKGGG